MKEKLITSHRKRAIETLRNAGLSGMGVGKVGKIRIPTVLEKQGALEDEQGSEQVDENFKFVFKDLSVNPLEAEPPETDFFANSEVQGTRKSSPLTPLESSPSAGD